MAPPSKFSFAVLSDGELVLTLGEVCIQTAARQAHRELVQALLDEGAAVHTHESLVDLLAGFLKNTDFAALRAAHPELAGGIHCSVRLYLDREGHVRWKVIGQQ